MFIGHNPPPPVLPAQGATSLSPIVLGYGEGRLAHWAGRPQLKI